jgi:hypothetical protein
VRPSLWENAVKCSDDRRRFLNKIHFACNFAMRVEKRQTETIDESNVRLFPARFIRITLLD